jgi:hypothetical protein
MDNAPVDPVGEVLLIVNSVVEFSVTLAEIVLVAVPVPLTVMAALPVEA